MKALSGLRLGVKPISGLQVIGYQWVHKTKVAYGFEITITDSNNPEIVALSLEELAIGIRKMKSELNP